MDRPIRLSIAGMACAGCVTAVEEAMRHVEGVTGVVVNLGERTAVISGNASAAQLIEAVKGAGFDAAELLKVSDELAKEQRELTEYRTLWRRAWIAGSIGLLLFITGMGGLLPGVESARGLWLGIGLLTLLTLIFVGGHFFVGAWRALKGGRSNMDSLVALGTGTAWLYSMGVVLFPEAVPSLARHAYFEAAVIIIALVSLGSALESRARGRTSLAIKRLLGLQPRTARVIRNGTELDLPVEEIGLEESIRILPGDRIPVDGRVVEGDSHVDQSMLTGESMPLHKGVGDTLYGGTTNTSGSLLMSATHIGRDTALAHIIELVRNAQSTKPAIGRLVDRVAAIFVPVVIAIAITSFALWQWLGPEPTLGFSMVAAMTVLVIACPCALGLATPIAIMVSVGRAASLGILIRNGEALQQAGRLTTVVLDKTGTITTGEPRVVRIDAEHGVREDELLALAAALEHHSEHPLASAILAEARQRCVALQPIQQFSATPGMGISGLLESHQQLRVGNRAMMEQADVSLSLRAPAESAPPQAGTTPLYVAINRQLLGIISIADPPREESAAAIRRLRSLGLQVIMLTGDSPETAAAIAEQVGIDSVIAEVLPGEKAGKIEALQQQGEVVAMVGDGINDAPALAQADVGIAIGTGADVAVEAADIALMHGALSGVADTIALSRATLNNIRQNLLGAFIYNILAIPVAAGALYPTFGLLLNPMIAAAAMSMSSVTVVSNALRLLKIRLQ